MVKIVIIFVSGILCNLGWWIAGIETEELKSFLHCSRTGAVLCTTWSENRVLRKISSPEDQGWKALNVGHCFFSIFDYSRKNNGWAFWANLRHLWGYTFTTFTSHTLGLHTWKSPGPNQESMLSAPKQWRLDVHVKSKNPVRLNSQS